MSIRYLLTLPTLGLIATGCPADDPATTADESSSTGGDEEDESETTDEPTTTTDDPTTDPDTSSSTTDDPATTDPDTSSSTGPEMLCGNGDVDDGEECDDENTLDGDTCTATCTLPVEEVWQVSYNGSASNQDNFIDGVVDGDGNIIVVGRERVTDEGFNLLVRQYLPDGTEGWSVSYEGLVGGGNDEGAGIALLPDGDIVVVGTSETEFDVDDIFAARLDGTTQAIEWEVLQDGPGMGPGENDDADFGGGIAVDPDGNTYITGAVRVGPLDWDIFTAKYDADGVEVWQHQYTGAFGGGDFGRGVVVDAEGVTWVAATEEIEDGEVQGVVLSYDADGALVDADQQTLDFFPNAIEIDPDGNFVVFGDIDNQGTFWDIVVREYDATWTESWSQTIDHSGSDDFAGANFSVGADGNVYIGGTTRVDAAQFDAYARVLDTAGTSLYSVVYGNAESMLDDQYNIVLGVEGDFVAAGFESVLGEQTNGLLTRYHPL
jgi:cysteine-rich repeat protein